MVRRLAHIFHQELSSVHNAALVLGVAAALSSVLAIVRDRLFAGTFGAGRTLDLYYAAFRIPDALYTIFLTLVSVTALIPLLLEFLDRNSDSHRRFLDSVFTVFLLLMVLASGALFFAAPYIAPIMAPGFLPEELATLVTLTRIMLLSPLFLGLSNIFSGIVQSMRRFFIYAASPIVYNIGIILGVLVLYPIWGTAGLAAGVVLGALMHMGIQLPGVIRLRLMPRFSAVPDIRLVWRVAALSLPRSIGLSLTQLVMVGIVAIGSLVGAGSIAVFTLAYNLQSVPLTVVGLSYSIAAFPTLARLFVRDDTDTFRSHVGLALRNIIFWSVPASVFVIVLRAHIVRVLFGTGVFGWVDTRLTAAALAIFSVSMIGQAIAMLLVRAHYAAGRTKAPIIANVAGSIITIGAAIFLVKLFSASTVVRGVVETAFRVGGIPGTGVLMLAVAFSFGALANAAILYGLWKRIFGLGRDTIRRATGEATLAALAMGGSIYGALRVFEEAFDIQTFIGVLLHGLLSGVIGIVVWVCVLSMLNNKELTALVAALRRRFWKTDVVVPELEQL